MVGIGTAGQISDVQKAACAENYAASFSIEKYRRAGRGVRRLHCHV